MLDAFTQFFAQWGYIGLFLGSFVAGSVFPFSSEALVIACVGPLHMDKLVCLLAATFGNVCGGMTCYWLGHLGKIEWIERYAKVSKEKLDRTLKYMEKRGAWLGFLAWVPMLGTAISVALGYVRTNVWLVLFTMAVGKVLRYAAVIWGTLWITSLFH